ncbi:NAD(P)H-hydrate dehydratase [Legionella impletisoli]|uniref:Bifunctional NAD(P)H-hydrate repair enzyme n=1 Tax=Legionella impletisoli TaxID=343510 RepID=A0A917NAH1_9GAMM|nr:NAD(P)H-hydrate dehydratase [Legionella impletisoli]GGI83115.1 bifunctional NAD(P)H-hydrate repair enzyme [Legionella impletisoli]
MPKDTALYQTSQIRQLEQQAIEELGIQESELMKRAGFAAFRTMRKFYNQARHIAVFCGGGNNGGDGYVLARLAAEEGLSVIIYHDKPIEELPHAAAEAAQSAIAAGVQCLAFDDALDPDVELIVDALLGIGLEGTVHGAIEHAIEMINDSGLPIVSLDVPSGLNADTGLKLGTCVRADITTTFIGAKVGLYTVDGPDHSGEIICHDLQLEKDNQAIIPAAYLLEQQSLCQSMPPRKKNSHKGLYGHVLVIGGAPGMPGAPWLAAMAALRVGAGMVTLATHPEQAKQVLPGLPEAMVFGVADEHDLKPLFAKATVCVLGPGLGEDSWAERLFTAAIAAQLPLVIDASALRLLARNQQHDDNWILTPHPGEAAELLGCNTETIQRDRLAASRTIQEQYGGSVIIKGVGTIIDSGENERYLCPAGNPGMATAGMGDVLSGVIGGLLAQGLDLPNAATLGVWLHAKAGDDAAVKYGERGLTASDLMPFLRRRINSLG